MHEITLIFDVFQRPYYLRLVLQLQFFITSRARLEISHFFMNCLVWVNDSFPSMLTIIKHIKGYEMSLFLSRVFVHGTNAQTPVFLLHGFISSKTPVSTRGLDV